MEDKNDRIDNYMAENREYRAEKLLYLKEQRAYLKEKKEREEKKAALEHAFLLTQMNIAIMKQADMFREGKNIGVSLYEINYPADS